jgi:CTP:molybdopterin cytidylyltransferase MocA
MPVAAILLAAGASRRLGRPKQLVEIAGETLLGRTLRIVRESGPEPTVVVLGAYRESIAATVDLSAVHAVMNPDWEQGIASSIHAGIAALRQIEPAVTAALLLVCDQPRLTSQHLSALTGAHEQSAGETIVASHYAGIAGIPAIFPASQFESLMALRGDAGARSILRSPPCPMVAIAFAGGEVDIDTPLDLGANLETWSDLKS